MNRLTVIIPSRSVDNLWRCLPAVKSNDRLNIIVVDDGVQWPTNGRAEWNLSAWGVTDVIQGAKPFVFSRNVNLGIKAAGTDDIVLLNDDALLCTPGGFTRMQMAAETRPNYGIISATCNNVGNANQRPTAGEFPEDLVRPILRQDPRMVCFVAVLITRRTIDRVGLLCEHFTGYGFEDDDYCSRVRQAGLKIGIHEGCFVDHASLKSTFRGSGYPSAGFRHNQQIYQGKLASGEYNSPARTSS